MREGSQVACLQEGGVGGGGGVPGNTGKVPRPVTHRLSLLSQGSFAQFFTTANCSQGWCALQAKEMMHPGFLSCMQCSTTAMQAAEHFLQESFICKENSSSHPIKRKVQAAG